MHLTQPLILYVIKLYVPNNRKNDSNGKEEKACYKNTAVISLFSLAHLSLAVIGILLMLSSAHWDKCEHSAFKNKAYSYESAFAAYEKHSRKERHQDTRDEKRIC